MPNKLTAVSLFSGCGGFDWGAQQAGVEILWANDIDLSAADAYQATFPLVHFHNRDIKGLPSSEIPEADVLIGCYPCTGFSQASRRRGRLATSPRDLTQNKGNYLYEEFLRALTRVKPRYLFVENVEGMLSAKSGEFFDAQMRGFKEAGYRMSFAKLNASAYGVCQTRERVFIVGVRRDIKFRYEFAPPTHVPYSVVEAAEEELAEAVRRANVGLPPLRKKTEKCRSSKWTKIWRTKDKACPEELLTMERFISLEQLLMGKCWKDDDFFHVPFHGHYLTRNRKRLWGQPSFTIVAHGHHVPLHPGGLPMVPVGKDKWALQGSFNRRLSWRECAAIQGLPESAVPSGSLSDKYRVVGNAVPPAFGKALLSPVVEFENSL